MTAPSDRGRRRMFNLQTAVGLLVTGGIIWLGLTRIDLSQTMAAFAAVRVGFVLAGGGLIVAAIAIFAVRWRVLLPSPPDVPVRFFFCYLIIGYMVNAIIPLRLGDLVRAYLLGRRHGIAVSTTLSTVVVERIFDVVAIVVIGLLVSSVLDLPPLVKVGLRTFAFVGMTGMSLLYGLSFWGQWTKRLAWLDADAGRVRWLRGMLLRLDYFCKALTVLHDGKRLAATSALTSGRKCTEMIPRPSKERDSMCSRWSQRVSARSRMAVTLCSMSGAGMPRYEAKTTTTGALSVGRMSVGVRR